MADLFDQFGVTPAGVDTPAGTDLFDEFGVEPDHDIPSAMARAFPRRAIEMGATALEPYATSRRVSQNLLARYTTQSRDADRLSQPEFESLLADVAGSELPPTVKAEVIQQARGIRAGKLTREQAKDFTTRAEGNVAESAAEGIRSFAEETFPLTPAQQKSLPVQVAGGAGTAAGFLATRMLPGGRVALPALAASMGAGEAIERAMENGASDEEAARAGLMGVAPGLTDIVPIERLLRPLARIPGVKGALYALARRMVDQGVIEGTQEPVQGFMQNAIERVTTDENQPLLDGLGRDALVGTLVGMLFGAGAGIRDARRTRSDTEVATDIMGSPDVDSAIAGAAAAVAEPAEPPALPAPRMIATPEGEVATEAQLAEREASLGITPDIERAVTARAAQEAEAARAAGVYPTPEPTPTTTPALPAPRVVVTPEGQAGTEAQRAAAQAERERLGITPDIERVIEARRSPIVAPEAPRETRPAPKPGAFLRMLASAGGISRADAEAQGIDPAHFADALSKRVVGKPLFPKDRGMTFDEAAEFASQRGFGSEAYSANEFLDLLDLALRGEEVVSRDDAFNDLDARMEAERERYYDTLDELPDVPEAPAAPPAIEITPEDIALSGYNRADPPTKDLSALLAVARNRMGEEAFEDMLERVAAQNEGATDEQFETIIRQEIESHAKAQVRPEQVTAAGARGREDIAPAGAVVAPAPGEEGQEVGRGEDTAVSPEAGVRGTESVAAPVGVGRGAVPRDRDSAGRRQGDAGAIPEGADRTVDARLSAPAPLERASTDATTEKPAVAPATGAGTATPPPGGVSVSADQQRDYSSSQVALKGDDALRVKSAARRLIAPDDIDPTEGIEERPHITLKFGLHAEDPGALAAVLQNEGPITATVRGIEIFEADEHDVVVLRVESDDLTRLNRKVSDAIEHTDTHPDYKPHITLGYVKKGRGQKYADATTGLEGRTLRFDAVEFSGKDGTVTPIGLKDRRLIPASKRTQAAASPQSTSTIPQAQEVAPTGKTGAPDVVARVQAGSVPSQIVDVGEKVGGARKDLAEGTGQRVTRERSEAPGWRSRYEVAQITKSTASGEEGRWVIHDKRREDWRGRSAQVGERSGYATREEAEAAIPLIAVSRNHRVVPVTVKRELTEADVDAMVELDSAAAQASVGTEESIAHGVVEKAKRRLKAGEITQAQYDGIVEKFGEAAARYTPAELTRLPASETKWEIWRDVTDRKRVKVVAQQFESRDDALRHMARHAAEIIETKTSFGEEILPVPDRVRREGPERRTGNVKGDDFMRAFGFRAVEFGNWENQAERQQVMNHAYDALADLAETLDVPLRAIGLNGELALAFGARGHGLTGARAHYETSYGVINLTKMKGAGSLAHEWFHALDHYLARQDTKATREKVRNRHGDLVYPEQSTDAQMVSHGFRGERSGVRPELRAAYDHVIDTMLRKAEQYVEDTEQADRFVARTREDAAKALADIRKDLAEQKDVRYWKRNNKPASAEHLAEFDTVAEQMIAGDFLETEWRVADTTNKSRLRLRSGRLTNDALEKISAIYKAVRGRSGFGSGQVRGILDGLRGDMQRYSARLKMLADAQRGEEKTKKVPTSFAMEAKSIDQGRATGYWTTPHEMAARAFQAYVEDKIGEQGGRSDFLTYGTRGLVIPTPWGWAKPFPEGAEREAINSAFNRFVETLETRETDEGVALFSLADDAQEFADAVDAVLDGTLDESERINMGATAEVLRAVGLPALPLATTGDVIDKVHYDHGLARDQIKRLPAVIADPIMVFESDTRPGTFVVVTDEVARGLPVVAAIHPNREMGRADVNLMASAYPRQQVVQMRQWIKRGLLRYVNKARSPAWQTTVGVQFPEVGPAMRGLKTRVLTEADIVKDDGTRFNISDRDTGARRDETRDADARRDQETETTGQRGAGLRAEDVRRPEAEGQQDENPQITKLRTAVEAAIGRALPQGSFTPAGVPDAVSDLATAIKRIFGKDVVFFRNHVRDRVAFHGIVLRGDNRTIYLDIDSQRPLRYVAGHELLHLLRKDHTDIYNRVYRIALDEFRPEAVEAFGQWVEREARGYGLKRPSEDLLHEEMMANFFGDNLADPAFWARLARKDQTLFQRFADIVRRLVTRLLTNARGRGYRSATYFRDLERMRDAAAEALTEYARRGTVAAPADDTDTRFDLADLRTMGRAELIRRGRTLDAAFDTRQPTAQLRAAVERLERARPAEPASPAPPADIPVADDGGGQPHRASWDGPEPSKLDTFIAVMQDKHIDTKRVVQAIRNASGALRDATDAYLQEELYHGRVAKRVQDFLDTELRPLLNELAMRRVTMAELEEYLHARHAEERNAQIARINPDMPDGGSGMTTAEARAYLDGLDRQKRRAYEALARRVDAMTRGTRGVLIAYGLESAETIATWEAAYENYVPLFREDMENTGLGTGQGYSVRGPASRRATGSQRRVVDILANIAQQRERTITRGEKTRVSLALIGLAIENPNPDFWKVDRPPTEKVVDPRTGLVVTRVDPLYKSRPNVIVGRAPNAEGEIVEHFLVLNKHNERAMRLAEAMKNLDGQDLGELLSLGHKATRYFASINTQYNPVFGVINMTRDVQGAMLNLTSTPLRGHQREVLKHTLSALRGIYIDARAARSGEQPRSTWAELWDEFQREGGQTGYRELFRTSKTRAESIEREIRRALDGKTKLAGRAIFDWLSDYNLAMENAVRLAAYKVGLEQGLSKQRAASLAKNLTVNFNRRGQIGTQAGALYAFFNASVQGVARMGETMAGPAGRKILTGGVLLGVAQAVTLAIAGFDEDDIPEFVKARNLIIPIGGKRYITIPMPLGFNVIPNLGRIPTEFAINGFRGLADRVVDLLDVTVDAFNPLGNAGMSLQTIAPTVIDPIAALAENKEWTGRPVALKDFSSLAPTPGHTRVRDTASEFSRGVSWTLNRLSGGTQYTPGVFSPTPDQIDYLIGQLTGGVGREYMKLEQTLTSFATGEELPTYKIPLFGRYFGSAEGQTGQAHAFYNNIRELNLHEAEIKGRLKAGEPSGGYYRAHPEARLWRQANSVYTKVSKLRRHRRDLVERGEDRARIRAIDERITLLMQSFNDRVERAREPSR